MSVLKNSTQFCWVLVFLVNPSLVSAAEECPKKNYAGVTRLLSEIGLVEEYVSKACLNLGQKASLYKEYDLQYSLNKSSDLEFRKAREVIAAEETDEGYLLDAILSPNVSFVVHRSEGGSKNEATENPVDTVKGFTTVK